MVFQETILNLPRFLEDPPEPNDYEMKRLQNIKSMAKEKKLFKANLKVSANALKKELRRKYQCDKPLIKCDLCKRSYKSPNFLEKHKRLVHKVKPKKIKSEVYFECRNKTCSEKFKTYNMIKEHIEKNHTFTCSACNESFKTKYKEKSHNCFPFICDCRKKFKNEQDLAAHDCHRCKYCNEAFRSKEAVMKHQPRHFNSYSGVYDLDLSRQEPLNIWTRNVSSAT